MFFQIEKLGMNSISLTPIQKIEYNITWIENYRLEQAAMAKKLKEEILSVQRKISALDFEQNWADQWNSWKPDRQVNHMMDSLHFFQRADIFLKTKLVEMNLLLKFNKDTKDVNPIELAQHQVRHQHVLEKLENISRSDCEELLAQLEQGMFMVENDDQTFQVKLLR